MKTVQYVLMTMTLLAGMSANARLLPCGKEAPDNLYKNREKTAALAESLTSSTSRQRAPVQKKTESPSATRENRPGEA